MITAGSSTMNQAIRQTSRTRCRVFHIGLDSRETLVIESVFRMNPGLASQFVFGAPTNDDPIDVVFVNGDSAQALGAWDELHRSHPETMAIIATASERDFAPARTVRKPLSFRNFENILETLSISGVVPMDVQPPADERLRILVVDSSAPARQFMKFKLEELAGNSLRVQVDFADSGEKALRCAQENAYDLVFVDAAMPEGMDGYETCARIKAEQPARVAMLTSRSAPVDFTRGRTVGCDNYLPKPPNDIDLRTVLRLTSLKKMAAANS